MAKQFDPQAFSYEDWHPERMTSIECQYFVARLDEALDEAIALSERRVHGYDLLTAGIMLANSGANPNLRQWQPAYPRATCKRQRQA
jgi:hypothetical protein